MARKAASLALRAAEMLKRCVPSEPEKTRMSGQYKQLTLFSGRPLTA